MSQDKGVIKKQNLISIKGQTLTRADYRGLLALLLVCAFLYVVLANTGCEATASLGPLTGAAVTYYFQSKSHTDGNLSEGRLGKVISE